jgi:hypothetical protein
MKIEDGLAQFQGQMDAVVLACSTMVATHPEHGKILAALSALAEKAQVSAEENSQAQHYKMGVLGAVKVIAQGAETARLAEDFRDINKDSGAH